MINNDDRIPPALKEQLIDLYRRALEQGVPIEELEESMIRYIRRFEAAEDIEEDDVKAREERLKLQVPKAVRYGAIVLPLLFLSIGMYLVGSAVVPILGYYVQTNDDIRDDNVLAAPIPQSDIMDNTPLVAAANAKVEDYDLSRVVSPTIVSEELDFTNLNNWFEFDASNMPELNQVEGEQAVTEYILDIPSLDIENAVVKIGGNDLNESLIQYPGTADPGQKGAPVIFGHSVLRQFYNPSLKNPRRYNSIFSYIMTLKPGDQIFVTENGTKYTYVVQEKLEVKPEDVHILNQDYGASRLKLVTCVPEGTYLRRGVVIAQLVED